MSAVEEMLLKKSKIEELLAFMTIGFATDRSPISTVALII
jgi:hypothetical protein